MQLEHLCLFLCLVLTQEEEEEEEEEVETREDKWRSQQFIMTSIRNIDVRDENFPSRFIFKT